MITNLDIMNEIKNFILEQFEIERKLDEGGKIRQFSGEIVENVSEMIWNLLSSKYPKVDAQIYTGKDKPYKIIDPDGNYINESVDKHCYINGKLVLAIECKTYLDKCYMQRADSDFNLLKSYNKDFDAIIISQENAIGDNSFNFFLNRKNIDKVYYFADGKRNSSKFKRIYYNPDRLNDNLILTLINDMEKYFMN